MNADAMKFTFLACADLKRIWDSIATPPDLWSASASDTLSDAADFAGNFSRHCELLASNPEMGAQRNELQHGLLSSPFRKYVVFYRVRGSRVEILRVLRATQDIGQFA